MHRFRILIGASSDEYGMTEATFGGPFDKPTISSVRLMFAHQPEMFISDPTRPIATFRSCNRNPGAKTGVCTYRLNSKLEPISKSWNAGKASKMHVCYA